MLKDFLFEKLYFKFSANFIKFPIFTLHELLQNIAFSILFA